MTLLSSGIQYHVRDVLEKIVLVAQHRAKNLANEPYHVPTDNVHKQLKFIQDLEKRQTEQQKEAKRDEANIILGKKSNKNPDMEEQRDKAKHFQDMEKEAKRKQMMGNVAMQQSMVAGLGGRPSARPFPQKQGVVKVSWMKSYENRNFGYFHRFWLAQMFNRWTIFFLFQPKQKLRIQNRDALHVLEENQNFCSELMYEAILTDCNFMKN